MSGKIVVFTGPMRCRKTLDLIIAAYEAERADLSVVAFFPTSSSRWGIEDAIVSRLPRTKSSSDSISYPAHPLRRDLGDLGDYVTPATDVVLFDDAQFFGHEIIMHADRLRTNGVDVYVAGLDMDCFKQPFGPMPYLMAISDKVRKRTTVCFDCSAPAVVSYRLVPDESQEIIGDDEYISLCHDCYNDRAEDARTPVEMRLTNNECCY